MDCLLEKLEKGALHDYNDKYGKWHYVYGPTYLLRLFGMYYLKTNFV